MNARSRIVPRLGLAALAACCAALAGCASAGGSKEGECAPGDGPGARPKALLKKLPNFLKPPKLKDPTSKALPGPGSPTIPVIPDIVPPAPTPPPQSALGLAPGAPPPGGPTVWSRLGLSAEQREFRRRQLSETPFGKLAGVAIAPFSRLSGGLIPPLAPATPTLGQLLDKGPVGAAAKVKLDALNAKKRKEAVEQLKDVDCHYWPEAEDALIAALRTDRNEAVRYTAAQTLGSGRCCTKKTVEALAVCASGSDRDGAPCEVSEAVRATAAKALMRCLACQCLNRCGAVPCDAPGPPATEERPREEPPREPPGVIAPAGAKIAAGAPGDESDARRGRMKRYYDRAGDRPTADVLAGAQSLLRAVEFPPGADAIPAGHPDYIAVDMYPDVGRARSGPRARDDQFIPRTPFARSLPPPTVTLELRPPTVTLESNPTEGPQPLTSPPK
jgi:hypothetical protein